MPINEHGAEVINGYVVLQSEWNTAKTARTIIAVRLQTHSLPGEYVTAVAGPIGCTEWYGGHYFNAAHDSHAFSKACKDYESR